MKYRFIIFSILVLVLTSLVVVPDLYAQPTGITNPSIGGLGNNPQEASTGFTFARYFATLWINIISIGAFLLLLYFIWGAIEWITAGGDSGKVGKARDRIVNSIIGMIILAGSFVIIGFIGRVFFSAAFEDIRILNFIDPNDGSGQINQQQLQNQAPAIPGNPNTTLGN